MNHHHGNIFVLSAPSGTGKSTLAKRLVKDLQGLIFSISFTTRKPREGEVHGEDYFFIEPSDFDRMVSEDGFAEWVEVYGNRYGTGRNWIREKLESGVDILLDIETKGARNVRQSLPESVMIFLLPPSAEDLSTRLRGRGKDSEEQIRMRLQYARHEMEQLGHYDYLIVNDDLELAYQELKAVVLATRCKQPRMAAKAASILSTFPNA